MWFCQNYYVVEDTSHLDGIYFSHSLQLTVEGHSIYTHSNLPYAVQNKIHCYMYHHSELQLGN